MPLRDVMLALLVVTIWGFNFVAIKWGVEAMPPLLLTALRYLAAAIPAVLLVRPPAVPLRLLLAYGLLVGAAQFGLLFLAIDQGMPAGLASLVLQTQAIFTMALAVGFLGERLHPMHVIGAVAALFGIGTMAIGRYQDAGVLPLLMVIGAAAFWGASNILTKKAGNVDMLGFVAWSSLVPPLPLFALSLAVDGPQAILDGLTGAWPEGLFPVLYNGLVSTLVGYVLWSVLIKRNKASAVAPFSLLVPVVGLSCGYLILGEPMSPMDAAGAAAVFFGLALAVLGPRAGRSRPGT